MQNTTTRPVITVTADGRGVASQAGSRLLAGLADVTGVPQAFSEALGELRRRSRHDPGRVLVDVAVMLADGGEAISDLSVLRDQPELFGAVASTATAWRVLDSVDASVPGWPGPSSGESCRLPPRVGACCRAWSSTSMPAW